MAAGESADQAAQLFAALAEERADAEACAEASGSARRIARLLAPLSVTGMHFLVGRQWPGSGRARMDLVAVGPQGVFVIDAKAWVDVSVGEGRIYQAQEDVTDDLLALADLSDVVEHELAAIGLAPGEVHVVAVLAGYRDVRARVRHVEVVSEDALAGYIVAHRRRLTESQVDVVLRRLLDLFPPREAGPGIGANEEAEPELTADPVPSLVEEIETWLAHADVGVPLEEWMTFLHPEQAMLVRRSFSGPACIRGAAGTGKSVVALHRAAYVARTRQVRVLVTGFVRQMPPRWGEQMALLAPDAAGQVDFRSVYQLAVAVLRAREVALNLDKATVARSFEAAWSTVNGRSLLRQRGLGKSYWMDEIAHVIKGRGLRSFEEYAAISRAGRGQALNLNQRYEMWSLYEQYAVGLRRYKVHDWTDVILLAEQELRERPWGSQAGDAAAPWGGVPYGAVVVDEAQDLSCAMVRMLHALVGDAPDAFLLFSDPQQAVYPGAFALEEAGVSVEAREAELTVNHRNTVQVAEFALALVGAEGPMPVGRQGPMPEISRHGSRDEHDRALVGRVLAATSTPDVSMGDVVVLAEEYRTCQRVMAALAAAGLPVVDLTVHDGSPVEAVKVGTIKRFKGFDSWHVLLADLRPGDVEMSGGGGVPEDGAARERWELERRERYVAMTRAREGLWLGVVG